MRGVDERTSAGEVLDLGVVGEDGSEPPPRAVSRRAVLLTLGGAALAGGGVVAARSQRPTPPPPPPLVTHGRLRRPIEGVPLGWQLFGLGSEVVVRVDPATSAVTQTRIPAIGDSQVFLVVGRRRVVVHPVTGAPGLGVPDDEAPTTLPASVTGIGAVLPGPDLDHLWIQSRADSSLSMVLLDADGWGSLPVDVPVPQFATTGPIPDGAGGLIFEGVGGIYRISPTGNLTLSDGIVLAVGRGGVLVLGPGTGKVWRTIVHRRDGTNQEFRVPIGPQLPHGVLAPDAASVVLYVVDDRRRTTLSVVRLATGEVQPLDVDITGVAGDGTVLWSPDGSRLFCLDTDGRVRVLDPATGNLTATLDLPPLRQLALRFPAS